MISTEVQRTLVKSPPELWAEISDPEALARHLGEFGEIRITRVQPEQKVEWEAPKASGSIVIKPSGWGTKVRLTVTRELPENDVDAEPAEMDEAAGAPTVEQAQQEQGEPPLELEMEAEDEPEPHAQLDVAQVEALHDEAPLDEARLDEALHDEARLDEARLDENLLEEDLLEEARLAEDPLDEDLAGDPLDEEQPEQSEEQVGPPARRLGFFARLFGRRRSAGTETGEAGLPAPETSEARSDTASLAADRLAAPDRALSLAADKSPAPDRALTLAEEVALVETELDEEPEPAPASPATPSSLAPTIQAATASETAGRMGSDDAVEDHLPDDGHADIAAELERAEAAAEEEVTAVLTGVLDRLGSAHHRPFSRA